MKFPAVFLDRDGTLNEDAGYLDRLERLVLFPWSIDAVRLLNRAGFRVVMVTNQAGIARGILDEVVVRGLHDHISAVMAAGGARIDAWYYCPHHPDASVPQFKFECECRKPRVGMIRQAERDLDIDTARSWVVGDRWLDVRLGVAAGARSILVRTGYGGTEANRPPADLAGTPIVANLIEATAHILRDAAGAAA